MQPLRTTLAVAAAALVLAGCNASAADPDGHDGHGQDSATVPSAETLEVEASSFTFSPARVELVAGEPANVSLTATDILHDLTIDETGFHVAADTGQTVDAGLTIDEPGTYTAYCSVPGHRAAGMELDVVVTD